MRFGRSSLREVIVIVPVAFIAGAPKRVWSSTIKLMSKHDISI
jgi:hypothetical protein